MSENKEFDVNDYDNYNDATDDLTQAWERYLTGMQILEDYDKKSLDLYLEQFSKEDRAKAALFWDMVQAHGYEAIAANVAKTLEMEK